jgi:hypothetical protein
MESTLNHAFPESLLAAMPQLSEKPHMGVPSKNPAWHPGFNVCNSTAVLGLQFRCSETVSGPVVAPSNAVTDFAKQWWKDVKSCVGGVGIPAIKNALNPFSLGVGTAANVASDMSQSSLAAAASYSVSKGLTVPLRSSIVRAGVGSAETLGKASGVLTVVSIDYALVQGVIAEWNGCL